MKRGIRRASAAAIVATGALLVPFCASAHEVPDDVKVNLFLKPEGNRLRILARVPTNAMIDILFPMRPGEVYIDQTQSAPAVRDAARLWVSDLLTIYEDGRALPRPRVLATQLSQAVDTSVGNWNDALAHVNGAPLPAVALLAWNRATLDVELESPMASDRSDFTFVPRFARIGVRVTTTLTFLPPGGGARTYVYEGDPEPFHLNPSWSQTAAHFVVLGFSYIWKEADGLLLIFCAAILFRRMRALAPFAAAYAAASSVALIAAWLSLIPAGLWFGPLIGALMAIAIIHAGLESIVSGVAKRPRPGVGALAGAIFGYGFWFYVDPLMQFGGDHPSAAVLGYDLGIEMAQLLALALMIPLIGFILRFVYTERAGAIVLAALAVHASWHRMIERAWSLGRYSVQWPVLEAASGVPVLALAALATALAAAAWSYFNRQRQGRTA